MIAETIIKTLRDTSIARARALLVRSPNEGTSLEGRLDYCLEIRREESIYYVPITAPRTNSAADPAPRLARMIYD
jgi:hypothetical protein